METVPPSVASAASQSSAVAAAMGQIVARGNASRKLWEDEMFPIQVSRRKAPARAYEGRRGTPTATMESSTTADEDVELVGATGVDVRANPSLPN
jgi:hypothetical protein